MAVFGTCLGIGENIWLIRLVWFMLENQVLLKIVNIIEQIILNKAITDLLNIP